MILSFSVQNFLSFRDKVTLSFESTNDKHLEEFHVVQVNPKTRINKLGVVYGANASGKSNLVKAFHFLNVFFDDTNQNKEKPLPFYPFLMDEPSELRNTIFELVFFIDSIKHVYELEVNRKQVITERLKKYKSVRPTELFSRWLEDDITMIGFNESLKISSVVKEELQVKCLHNMSVFAAYKMINAHLPEVDEVATWISQQLLSVVTPETKLLEYTKDAIRKNEEARNYVLGLMHQADFNIKDIVFNKIEHRLNDKQLAELLSLSSISVEEKSYIAQNKTLKVLNVHYSHEVVSDDGESRLVDLPEILQSDGTLRTMGLGGVFHRVLASNGFVAIDELESSLHPKLIRYLVETFLRESDRAQLLFTTHYDGLLAEDDLLRKDTIWFTEKHEDGATTLYSLSDFNGLNRISSLQKAYQYGKFGAVPNI
jgi:AAA15 family ATPase/GTPase